MAALRLTMVPKCRNSFQFVGRMPAAGCGSDIFQEMMASIRYNNPKVATMSIQCGNDPRTGQITPNDSSVRPEINHKAITVNAPSQRMRLFIQ